MVSIPTSGTIYPGFIDPHNLVIPISSICFHGTEGRVGKANPMCGKEHCVGSIEELSEMKTSSSEMPPELHRPYVDEVSLICPDDGCDGEMVREPYVMDCWFDSGCATFAQWHYPFENQDKFDGAFPVDYICEAVDQTRGWFYSLMAVSTTVFDSICYRRCLSLGHILDKDGKKMSKSRGNVVNPWDHFNKEGSDSIRSFNFSAIEIIFSAVFSREPGPKVIKLNSILKNYCDQLEIYSVDEAFLILNKFSQRTFYTRAEEIQKVIKKWLGVPVSIGIGRNKTLSKVANYLAKKDETGSQVVKMQVLKMPLF